MAQLEDKQLMDWAKTFIGKPMKTSGLGGIVQTFIVKHATIGTRRTGVIFRDETRKLFAFKKFPREKMRTDQRGRIR